MFVMFLDDERKCVYSLDSIAQNTGTCIHGGKYPRKRAPHVIGKNNFILYQYLLIYQISSCLFV